MNLYDFIEYKDVIREKISENQGVKAYQSRLAEAIGCNKPFFSQVLNSHVHLTPDHAEALARFWEWSEHDTDYFLDLVALARAGTPSLKTFLKTKIKKAQKRRGDPSERIRWPQLETAFEAIYYSSWYWSAIHILASSPHFSSTSAIAQRLGLSTSLVEETLCWLEERNFIDRRGGHWSVLTPALHLPNQSMMNETHQTNWRQKSISNIQKQDRSALHYSSVFTISEDDFHKLKEFIVNNIEVMNKVIGPSPCDDLYAFCCDLFRVT